MESLRLAVQRMDPEAVCCRCGRQDGRWDRIAAKAYCPDCQESLILGLSRPLAERAEKKCCATCGRMGTVCFVTFPLQSATALEIDLCPEHLRGLLGRRLGPSAYHQMCRQLRVLGVPAEEVFLLHSAFYDGNGRALQPAAEPE